jgi:hypothetical protein
LDSWIYCRARWKRAFLGPGGAFLLRSHLVEGDGDRFLFSIIGGGGYFDLAPGYTDIDLMQEDIYQTIE